MSKKTAIAAISISLIGALLFAWLSVHVVRNETVDFDQRVREAIHDFATPPLTRFMTWTTWLGSALVAFSLTFVLSCGLFVRRQWRWLALLLGAIAGETILEEILKNSFRRPRPIPYFGLAAPSSFSYPSGHSMTSFCLYGMVAILLGRLARPQFRWILWALAAILAALIGLSRIYLGVHYPTDVLAGYAAAAAWLSAVIAIDASRR